MLKPVKADPALQWIGSSLFSTEGYCSVFETWEYWTLYKGVTRQDKKHHIMLCNGMQSHTCTAGVAKETSVTINRTELLNPANIQNSKH